MSVIEIRIVHDVVLTKQDHSPNPCWIHSGIAKKQPRVFQCKAVFEADVTCNTVGKVWGWLKRQLDYRYTGMREGLDVKFGF